MKILHTSDWHLGRQLYNQKRTDEFEAFLSWLIETISDQNIDTLLVAGDVFDTTTPSASTLQMYFDFLHRASNTCCQNIVLIGGNHDSATLLNAPKLLLKGMNIHVVGEMCENMEEEVITLYDKNKQAQAIVCAVPYLRDRDVRSVKPYESMDEKVAQLVVGITAHYEEVANLAQKRLLQFGKKMPVVAMGHLFTTADRSNNGDGVRELYVGTLAHIDGKRFSNLFDYVALGHIHIAQKVGGEDHKRYSGSPIPMGFNEAAQTKKVVLVEFENGERIISQLEVPCFKKLTRISGSAIAIREQVSNLVYEQSDCWLEVNLSEGDNAPDLSTELLTITEKSTVTLLSVKDTRAKVNTTLTASRNETLNELTPKDVFEKYLESNRISEELKPTLITCFDEILMHYNEMKAENL